MSSARVLLTGGAGGVGVHTLAHLMHNTDWEVVLLDSFRHKGYRDRLTVTFAVHPEWKKRVTVIQHDLVCAISPNLLETIGNIDHVLHLAALSDVFMSVESPLYVIRNNVESTLQMLEYARQYTAVKGPLKSFVYFSTDEVYGPVSKGDAHREWDSHRPSNAYAASKAACEDISYCYWRSYGIPLIITNTQNNFGEMQSGSKFPALVQKAVSSGEDVIIHGNAQEIGTRYYIHSRNAADALLYILKEFPAYKHKLGEMDEPHRFHIVGDDLLSNLELAEKIARLMGSELSYKLVDFHRDNPGHDIHYGLQDNKLRPSGWRMPVPFDKSMGDTIAWQQEHPDWIR